MARTKQTAKRKNTGDLVTTIDVITQPHKTRARDDDEHGPRAPTKTLLKPPSQSQEEKVATEPPKQVRDEHVVKGEEDEEDVPTQPYDNGEGEESPQEADDDAAKKTDAINTESEAGFIGPKARGAQLAEVAYMPPAKRAKTTNMGGGSTKQIPLVRCNSMAVAATT